MFLGGMKAAFVLSYSSEPWRVRCLSNADVDSRVTGHYKQEGV